MKVFLNIVSVFAILFSLLGLCGLLDEWMFFPSAVLFVTGMATALILLLTKKPSKK